MNLEKKYDGPHWCIYYFRVKGDFFAELSSLGEVLEKLSKIGRIVAIIPNIGLVKASLLLGPSFQGVKGLAIVLEKNNVFNK